MDNKTVFVLGGDTVILEKDFTPPEDYYKGVTIKAGSLLEVHGYSEIVWFDTFLCYPKTVIDSNGDTIDNDWGFYVPISLCSMFKSKYSHLSEKEYGDE